MNTGRSRVFDHEYRPTNLRKAGTLLALGALACANIAKTGANTRSLTDAELAIFSEEARRRYEATKRRFAGKGTGAFTLRHAGHCGICE